MQIILVLLLGLALRLTALNQSLWLDEAIGAIVVKSLSYQQIISQFMKGDNHPPLYYLALKVWSSLFGYSEIALRSLSIIFGIGTILLVYLIARELFKKDKFLVAISIIFLATSPLHIYYSQEARMYIMAGFFASLAILSFLKTFYEGTKTVWWLIFAASLPLIMFSDYMPVFLLSVFWLYGLIVKKGRSWWPKFFLSHLLLLIFGLIWLPVFLIQVRTYAIQVANFPAWKSVAGGATLKQLGLVWVKFVLGRISFADKPLYYLLITIVSVPFVFVLSKSAHLWKKAKILWFWLVIPISLGFIASLWFPAFIYFRYIYVLPAFYLLLAWGIGALKNRTLKMILVGLVLAINIGSWLIYAAGPSQQRENWRGATSFLCQNLKKNEIVLFEFGQPFAPYEWYSRNLAVSYGSLSQIPADEIKSKKRVAELTKNVSGLYYFEYLRDLTDPQRYVESELIKQGFRVAQVYSDFPGVGTITYFTRD